jgi:hypothetical protein
MRVGDFVVKRRVWVGLGFALAAITAWWMWTRATPPPRGAVAPAPAAPAFVRLVGAGTASDEALRERAEMFDPTPLFFPTEWNHGQRPLPPELRRQPGQIFGNFGPRFINAEQKLKSYVGETVLAPDKLSDVLAQGNEAPYAGIGRIDVPRPALPERAAHLEVRNFGQNEPVLEQVLRYFTVPRPDFAPVEFLVVIGSAGVVGEPILTTGSGWEEVDVFFGTYLTKTFRLGERLSPGFYRVVVGP